MAAALRALPLAVAVVALASVGLGVARVWPELGRQHDRYASWSDYEIAHAGALHEHLDPAQFDAMRRVVPPGARYYLDVQGTKRTPAFVIRTFAAYWLLPSSPATRADADGVLRVRGERAEWLAR